MKHVPTTAICLMSLATMPLLHAGTVYPTPQRSELSQDTTQVESVCVLMRDSDSTGSVWDELPADKEGGYAICIEPGKATVYANDKVGLYYAKQTLSQMLEDVPGSDTAQRDPYPDMPLEEVAGLGELPQGTVIDWPDLPYRGTVEGYYGAPWSYEARKSQFEFYGRNKMNLYIYAPKDDPYHHGKGCYSPYPTEKAEEIRSLVKEAAANHVRFVWTIHPANTVKWEENDGREQLDALCRKMQAMYDLGVRNFAVFVDDSFGEIGKAARQVQLCNYLLENFIHKHSDVDQTLIMCPTGYNKGWTTPAFLNTLGSGLHPDIRVMWTGDTVVNDITLQGQEWVNGHVMRPTFIWWNWPCNDFKRGRLSMGRAYGMDTVEEMKTAMIGFVANPMEHAEASKTGLFGVADYTWNITGFDSDTSWRAGITRLYPEHSGEMQLFCNHNSYLLPNGHGYFREESVDIAPTAEKLMRSIEHDEPDLSAAAIMRSEFERVAAAGSTLAVASDRETETLRAEIAPWISAFKLTGKIGIAAMDTLRVRSRHERIHRFFDAVNLMAEKSALSRQEWSSNAVGRERDVEVGMYALTPAIRAAMNYTNTHIYAEIAGRPAPTPTFISNNGNAKVDNMSIRDSNPNTFWASECMQKKGHWYGLDYGVPVDIRSITLRMGGKRAQDFVQAGQFEISDDGQNWVAVGTPKSGPDAILNLGTEPVRARMIRFRVTEPRSRWVSIWDFCINRTLPPFAVAEVEDDRGFTAYRTEKEIGLNRVMEVFNFAPGEHIDLMIPYPVKAQWLELNFDAPDLSDWAKVELTFDDGSTQELTGKTVQSRLLLRGKQMPDRAIASVRVSNAGDKTQEIKLTRYRLGLAPGASEQGHLALTDSDISTFYKISSKPLEVRLHIPEGTTEIIVVGSAVCEIEGAEQTELDCHLRHFSVKPETRSVIIRAPRQPGCYLNEVIFR